MKKRINNIVNFRKYTVIIIFTAIVAAFVIGIVYLTNSKLLVSADNITKNSGAEKVLSSNEENKAVTVNTEETNLDEPYSAPKDVISYLESLQSKLPSASDIDKDSMLKKMYNTGAYIVSASGEFEEWNSYGDITKGNTENIKYAFKISNNKKILNYESYKLNDGTYSNGAFIISYDGKFYSVNETNKTYTVEDMPLNEVLLPDNPIVDYNTVLKMDSDGSKSWGSVFGPIASDRGKSQFVLAPTEIYNMYLLTSDTWNVTSSENYLGYNCVIIEGTSDGGNYKAKSDVKSFKFWVDSATGVLLKYEMYDMDGNITQKLDTKTLEINKKIPDSFFQLNREDYKDITNELVTATQRPQEAIDLEAKISEDITKKINDDKYKNVVSEFRLSTISLENAELSILMHKSKTATEEELQNLEKELKEIILTDINSTNIKINEIAFYFS